MLWRDVKWFATASAISRSVRLQETGASFLIDAPALVDKDNPVRKSILAIFVIAAAILPASAQDQPLFGTAGPLQDEPVFEPPGSDTFAALTTGEDAARLCARAVASKFGHSPTGTSKVSDAGAGKFLVEGTALAAAQTQLTYYCRVVHGEVAVLHLNSGNGKNAHGAGVLGLPLDGLETTAPPEHVVRHPAHPAGINPLHDLKFLRKACRHELRRHLAYDLNGPAAAVRLRHSRVEGRTLHGHGQISWRDGGVSRVNYACEFDRFGQISDGHYGYY